VGLAERRNDRVVGEWVVGRAVTVGTFVGACDQLGAKEIVGDCVGTFEMDGELD